MHKYSPQSDIVMSREQVREFDNWAINTASVPGVVLMENAGRSCAELINQKLTEINGKAVCIFCGTGNNGGDGFVIARHLANAEFKVLTVICGDPSKIKGDALINYKIAKKMPLTIENLNPSDDNIEQKIKAITCRCDIIVDALFGTGLTTPLRSGYDILVNTLNNLTIPIIAVDIPTGLDCDTGQPQPATIKAEATVTFVAVKKGFTNPIAKKHLGQLYIASIGITPKNNINPP